MFIAIRTDHPKNNLWVSIQVLITTSSINWCQDKRCYGLISKRLSEGTKTERFVCFMNLMTLKRWRFESLDLKGGGDWAPCLQDVIGQAGYLYRTHSLEIEATPCQQCSISWAFWVSFRSRYSRMLTKIVSFIIHHPNCANKFYCSYPR